MIAKAVTYAVQNGAKVINISLGGEDGASSSVRSAVNQAVGAGALVVLSAGNDGRSGSRKVRGASSTTRCPAAC